MVFVLILEKLVAEISSRFSNINKKYWLIITYVSDGGMFDKETLVELSAVEIYKR